MKGIARVIFLLTCISATVDTHFFVYPSLSRSFFLECGIAILFLVLLAFRLFNREAFTFSYLEFFVVSWIFYIVLQSCIFHDGEKYRMLYLIMTLFAVLVFNGMQKEGLLSRFFIESVLLSIAFIHIICIMGQHLGVLPSGNNNFSVTGCGENPTVAALFLTGVVPLTITRIKRSAYKHYYVLLLFFLLVCVILLRCRTAYVGLVVVFVVWFYFSQRKKIYDVYKRFSLSFPLLCFALLFAVICVGKIIYTMKRDSSEGRLLIWKLSSLMIIEHPLGCGYGLFEKNYNLRQAEYFASSDYSEREVQNADFVYVPYNDYLEHGVEGGCAGMFFLFAFYFLLISKSAKRRRIEEMAVLVSFAVMSLFNFVYTSISPWLLLMCYGSYAIAGERIIELRVHHPILLRAFLSLLSFIIALRIGNMMIAQYNLKMICDNNQVVADREYAQLESDISTSEAYWTMRAVNHFKEKRYEKARTCIHYARRYSSLPVLFQVEFCCLSSMGRYQEGILSLDTLANIAPKRLDFRNRNSESNE